MFTKHGPFPSGIQYQLLPDEAKRVCQIVRSKYAYGYIDVAGIAKAVYPGENTTTNKVIVPQTMGVCIEAFEERDIEDAVCHIQQGICDAVQDLVGRGVDREAIKICFSGWENDEASLYLEYHSLETNGQYNERMEKMALYQLMLDKVLPASLELAKEMKK